MTTQEAQAELDAVRPQESEAWQKLESAVAHWNTDLHRAQQNVSEIIAQRRDRVGPVEKVWLPLRQRKQELLAFLQLSQ